MFSTDDTSIDGPRRSLRTAELPMAFTAWEFWRGVVWAWAWFGMLFVAASVVEGVLDWAANLTSYGAGGMAWFLPAVASGSALFVVVGLVYAVPASFAATAVFSPVAYLLGRRLRSEPRRVVHLTVFATLGAVVSVTTTAAIVLWWGADLAVVSLLPYSVAAAAAVPLGWQFTATGALRDDMRPEVHSGKAVVA